MTRRRVLAISHDLELLRRIVDSLEAADAEVDAVRTPDAIEANIIPHRYVFFAIDKGNTEAVEALVARLRTKAQVVVIVPEARLEEQMVILRDGRVNHVVARNASLEHSIMVTARKLLTGDIFGIEKYLPPDTPVHYARLRDFEGRSNAINTILEFAAASKIRRAMRHAIGQACEELLMNALYDAPVDEHGQQIFAEVDPRIRTKTRSPKPVSIRYAATEHIFAVAVRDRFGRLAKQTILSYIDKCLHSSTQIDRKTYGAGLGIYLVASAASSYIVNVAYGIATEVICTFERRSKASLQVVGVFTHPEQAEMLKHGPRAEGDPGFSASPSVEPKDKGEPDND